MQDHKDFKEELNQGGFLPDGLTIEHISKEGEIVSEETVSPAPELIPGKPVSPEERPESAQSSEDGFAPFDKLDFGARDGAYTGEMGAVPGIQRAADGQNSGEGSARMSGMDSVPGRDADFDAFYAGRSPDVTRRPAGPAGGTKDTGPAEFDVDFDFDRAYEDYREPKEEFPIKRNRDRRTGCLGGLMYFAFIIAISAVLACCAWMAATDVLALGDKDGVIEVTVPRDFTMDEVTDMLYDQGLIKYKFLFKIFADFSSADEKISGGTYQLNTNYDYRALVNGMTARGSTKVEVEVTIPEGYTLRQIIELLVKEKICYEDELWEAAANYEFEYSFLSSETLGNNKRLEGFLFPDTYIFYMNDKPSRVFGKMLTNFENKFTDEYIQRAADLGYSVQDIVNIAAMIEKEAANDDERDEIASVIYNRLRSANFPHLQIDATIYYAIAGTGAEFSLEYDSPYNTYVCEGLPAGPISNPGIESIKAALYPADTNYYYYALGTDKVHHFFKSYDPFNAFVNSDEYGG